MPKNENNIEMIELNDDGTPMPRGPSKERDTRILKYARERADRYTHENIAFDFSVHSEAFMQSLVLDFAPVIVDNAAQVEELFKSIQPVQRIRYFYISRMWNSFLWLSKTRCEIAQHIQSERENKQVQSLFELAAQIVALHVVSPSDREEENPALSDPNFRISEKTGIKEVDETVESVISAAPLRSFGCFVISEACAVPETMREDVIINVGVDLNRRAGVDFERRLLSESQDYSAPNYLKYFNDKTLSKLVDGALQSDVAQKPIHVNSDFFRQEAKITVYDVDEKGIVHPRRIFQR